MKNNPEAANGKKEKMKQIKFYNNFIRFLARLAEYVVSLLKTLKNNLSDLVVTFARIAFQRNSAVIKVFLVSVVVDLGGTWQDLEILGPGLSEAVGKFALAPFIIKLRDKLSKKAIDDPEILGDLNRINVFGKRMESASTADQEEIFGKIKDAVSSINKRLKEIGKETIRIFGRVTDEDIMYSYGRSPDSRKWYKTKEKAFEASQPKDDKEFFKITDSPTPKYNETKLRGMGPEYKSLTVPFRDLRSSWNTLKEGKSLDSVKGFKIPEYIKSALRGIESREEKIKKVFDMWKELLENPRAFQIKYDIKTKKGVVYTDENLYIGHKPVRTKTSQQDIETKDVGFYPFERGIPKKRIIVSPHSKDAAEKAAKKKKENDKMLKDYHKRGLELGAITKSDYDEKIKQIDESSPKNLWEQELIDQGLEI